MFRLLGPFELTVEGHRVDLGAPKVRAVLAALLLDARAVVPVERLVDAVWEQEPPRSATHSIQVYVAELRKRLDGAGADARIDTRPTGYLLDPGSIPIDIEVVQREVEAGRRALDAEDPVAALSHLAVALEHWRGPPLEEFAYAEFAQPAIRRLRSLHGEAVAAYGAALVGAGRTREGLAELRGAFEDDPLDGETARLLMVAARDAGRPVEALRVYERHRRALAADLGIEPGGDVDRVYESVLSGRPPAVDRPEPARRNPFKGLRAFGEADTADFHGRDAEVSELVSAVAAGRPWVGVIGPSGSGKSSIVRAGLLPALATRAGGDVRTMVPGRHPMSDPALSDVDRDDGRTAVLVVDQFEEIYTLVTAAERDVFVDTLVRLAGGPVQVVAVLRADFYDRVLADHRLAERFSGGSVDVLPLDPPRLEEAAREPARRAGITIDDELVAELVAATARRPGSLPLFEYVLTELVDQADGGRLTIDAYRALGGVEGTLGRQADRLYERLPAGERETIRQILLRLTAEAGDPPTRRRVPLSELAALDVDPDVLDRALDALGRARLVTFGRDPGGGPTIEVAHEALLVEWGRLAAWIDAARADLARRRSLQTAIGDWRRSGRDPDYLPSGARLADLERWAEVTDLALTGDEREFVSEARRHEEARLRSAAAAEAERAGLSLRARRRLWAAVASVTVLAAVATYFLLAWLLAPGPPDVAVLVLDGDLAAEPGTFGALARAGAERAAEELGLDVELVAVDVVAAAGTVTGLAADGVGLLVHAYAGDLAGLDPKEMLVPGPAHVLMDFAFDDPGVSSIEFRAEHGSFLVGVAAAETTETGTVGFVGGMESPLIFAFQAGYEAGVRSVDPSIEVVSVYLGPCPDFWAFASPSLGTLGAEAVLAEGADVVYHAAGNAGYGVFTAVDRWSRETGEWRWAIGVDRDAYADLSSAAERGATGSPPGVDPAALRSHILTSMIKRYDVGVFRAIEAWAGGELRPGVTSYGLADDGVGYATSGGFVDHLVPELEAWRGRIVSGEVEVPTWPADRGDPEAWACLVGPTGLRGVLGD